MSDAGRHISIPGYEDWSLIGRGGFASVYRAYQPRFDRHVAVKVLNVGVLDDTAKRRFEREQQTMGALSNHPAIVTLLDAGFSADGSPYLVMELMSGGSMRDRLRRRGPLPWKEAVEIVRRISDGVAQAHHRGVLHRDIKPDNILTSEFGEAKLADFGIATLAEGSATATASVTATLDYAAPEVLSGERAVEASDVYGLAATLFSLLSGRSAFKADAEEAAVAVLARVLSAQVPDLRREGIPEAVCRAVEVGMAKAPGDRPQSAAAFASLLDEAVRRTEAGQLADGAPPPSGATRMLRREVVEHAQVAAAEVVAGSPTPPSPPPEPPRTRRRLPILIGGMVVVAAAVAVPLALLGGSGDTQQVATTAAAGPPTSLFPGTTTAAGVESAVPDWACSSTETPALFEDFDDGAAEGWGDVGTGAGWAIAAGVLQAGYLGDRQVSSTVYQESTFGDAALRVSMRMSGTGEKALQVDWRLDGEVLIDGEPFASVTYVVQFEADRGRLARVLTRAGSGDPVAEEMESWTVSGEAAADGWHGYEVARLADRVVIWVDGTQIASAETPGSTSGEIALLGFVAEADDLIELDQLRVCELGATAASIWPWPPPSPG